MSVYINNFNSIGRGNVGLFEYYFDLGESNVDTMLQAVRDGETVWTVDKNSGVTVGDINIFMCAVTSKDNINGIKTYVRNELGKEENRFYDEECRLYKKYAGTLMAIGIVKDMPYTDERMAFVPFDRIKGFDNPVPYSEFRDFISVSKTGSMTSVGYKEYVQLLSIIKKYNPGIDLSEFERDPYASVQVKTLKRAPESNRISVTSASTVEKEKTTEMTAAECINMFPVGCRVEHKTFGNGVVKENCEKRITIDFEDGEQRCLGGDFCVKNGLLKKI